VSFDIAPVNDVPHVPNNAMFRVTMGSGSSTLNVAAVLSDVETPISGLTLTITSLPAAGALFDGPTIVTTVPHVVADPARQLGFNCSSLDGLTSVIEPDGTRVGLTSIGLTAVDPEGASLSASVAIRVVDPVLACTPGSTIVVTEGAPACEPCHSGSYEVNGICQPCVSHPHTQHIPRSSLRRRRSTRPDALCANRMRAACQHERRRVRSRDALGHVDFATGPLAALRRFEGH
jgi:hypothetical protein